VLPNGVTTDWTYDHRDRTPSVVHKTSGGSVIAYDYSEAERQRGRESFSRP
jgi:hypothetical protein